MWAFNKTRDEIGVTSVCVCVYVTRMIFQSLTFTEHLTKPDAIPYEVVNACSDIK